MSGKVVGDCHREEDIALFLLSFLISDLLRPLYQGVQPLLYLYVLSTKYLY